MKWRQVDYLILVWATENPPSFFGESGQSYTTQKGEVYRNLCTKIIWTTS